MIGSNYRRFVSLYRLPNQSQEDFESFVKNFELSIDVVTAISSLIVGLREIRYHMRVLKVML